MINKINLIHAIQHPEKIDLTDEEKEKDKKEETTPGETETDEMAENEQEIESQEPHPLEDSFARILHFLYLAMMNTKSMDGSKMMICTKSSTMSWCEQQHLMCLQKRQEQERRADNLPIQQNSSSNEELVNLSQNFQNLTKAMTNKTILDMQREAEKGNGEGKFRKLPPMMKNTIVLFTMVPNMTQEELTDIKPTETFLSILAMTSGTVARDTLHHIMKSRGGIVCLQDGMCAGLKNGTLQSTDVFDINGLTPFHCGPEPCGKQLTLEQRAVLEETAALGKMTKDDITLLTKSETYLSKDFWAYEHQIKNFAMLCEIIGGRDCLTARAWRIVTSHAQRFQAIYKRLERENNIFYISLLDELHRRTQCFIHSCAHGKVDELNLKQLDFSRIFEEVENHRYYVKKPMWLPRDYGKRKPLPQAQGGGGGGGMHQLGGPPLKKRLFNRRERGDMVVNNDMREEMKVPPPDTYEKVFNPDYWRNVPRVNHPDGSEKCHNWHYRGRCDTKCPRLASHGKKLTDAEVVDGKEYVKKVLANYKKAVADGTSDKKKEPTIESKTQGKG